MRYQPEVNQYNACTLRELHALAVRKREESLKQRTLLELLTKVNVCMNACMCICTVNVVVVCNFTYPNKIFVAFDQRGSDN